jgi:hypothetical protein
MLKAGDLVKYASRLLFVVGFEDDKDSPYYGWARCMEVGTNSERLYHQGQLAIIKSEKDFYLK